MGFSRWARTLEAVHVDRYNSWDRDIRHIGCACCARPSIRVVMNLKVPHCTPMKPAFVSFVSCVSFGFAWRTFLRMNLLWTFWRLHVHVQLIWNFHKHQSRELHIFWDTFRRTLPARAFSVSNVSFLDLKIKGFECVSLRSRMCLSELRSGKMTDAERWCLSGLSVSFPAQVFFRSLMVMLWRTCRICVVWLCMILRLQALNLPSSLALRFHGSPAPRFSFWGIHPLRTAPRHSTAWPQIRSKWSLDSISAFQPDRSEWKAWESIFSMCCEGF